MYVSFSALIDFLNQSEIDIREWVSGKPLTSANLHEFIKGHGKERIDIYAEKGNNKTSCKNLKIISLTNGQAYFFEIQNSLLLALGIELKDFRANFPELFI